MTDWTDFIARALFYASALPAALFAFSYGAFSRWWVTDIGRILMGLIVSLLYIIGLSLAKSMFGDFPGRDIARIVGYTAILVGLWHMFFALRRIQKSSTNAHETRHMRAKEKR